MWKWLILFLSYFNVSYKKYDDEFRCEVAKHAVSHGALSKAKKCGVSESKVRGFLKSLKWQQADNPDVDFIALSQKKRSQLKFLPEEIDEKVINIIKSMRELGTLINYNIVITITKGIVTANDRTLLKENGGTIELRNKWFKSITKRIGFVKHKATTAKPISTPSLISKIRHIFFFLFYILQYQWNRQSSWNPTWNGN